jgi:hypothetical protein
MPSCASSLHGPLGGGGCLIKLEAQLNAACDVGAKAMLRLQDIIDLPQQEPFPLEPLCMFVEGTKMTSDT